VAVADGQLVFIGEARTPDVSTRPVWPPGAGGAGRALLDLVLASRSGDKGGTSEPGYQWVTEFRTVDRLGELPPETAPLRIERHILNIVIVGWLGTLAAAATRQRAGVEDLPEVLML
jgi:hypothetical protein